MTQSYSREIVASLPSLYPLTDYQEEAILTLTTPKDLIEKEVGEGDRAEIVECCPNCWYEIIDLSYKYCPICGQPIV